MEHFFKEIMTYPPEINHIQHAFQYDFGDENRALQKKTHSTFADFLVVFLELLNQ